MNEKNQKEKDYPTQEVSSSVVCEQEAVYETHKKYYTVDEFAEKFRVAINASYGYELIKENDWK
jgi:hypothetical protein